MQNYAYKPARLYFGKGDLSKEWYVEFYFLKPGNNNEYQRFKERFDINRIPKLKDRLIYGKELESFINQKLKQGFNPFTTNAYKKGAAGLTILQQMELIIGCLSQGETANAIRTFNDRYNRFKKYLEEKKLETISAADFREEHAEEFKEWHCDKKLQ